MLEEFAATRMGDVFIWRLFNEVAIGPAVWGRPINKDVVRKTIDEVIPSILDYLESRAPAWEPRPSPPAPDPKGPERRQQGHPSGRRMVACYFLTTRHQFAVDFLGLPTVDTVPIRQQGLSQ